MTDKVANPFPADASAQEPADENPFDAVLSGKHADATQEATQEANPFDDILSKDRVSSSAGGSFLRGGLHSLIPAAGTISAGAYGASLGAGLGPLGAIGGALLFGFGGSYLAGKGQDYAIEQLPDSWKDAIEEQEKADIQKHPIGSFVGGLVPFALTMSPGAWTRAKLPANATAMERLMSNPATAHLFGGAVQGGMELGQEAITGDYDWRKLAISTGFGIVFNKPNAFGRRIEGFGEAAGERVVAGAKRMLAPTVAQAGDAKVAGPGVTEEVFKGTAEQDPHAAMAAQQAAREEAPLISEPEQPKPDLHAIARRMEPELYAKHDELIARRGALERWQDEARGTPDEAIAKKQLQSTFYDIGDLLPQVAAAYRRAAEAAGAETVPAVPHGATVEPPKPAENIPENIPVPPAPGMIRFYHGTASENAEGFEGKTFVTPHFEYARDYRGGPNNVLYTDFTKEEAIKRGLYDEINGHPTNGAIEDGAQRLKPHTIIPKPVKPIAEQKAFIADDVAKQLIAAGRPAEEAEAAGALYAANFVTYASMFRGALGNAEELYRREGARIIGPSGNTRPPEPTAPAAPAAPSEATPAAPERDFRAEGRTAFAEGKPRRSPADLGSTSPADYNRKATEWLRGWDEANIAAPVEAPGEAAPVADAKKRYNDAEDKFKDLLRKRKEDYGAKEWKDHQGELRRAKAARDQAKEDLENALAEPTEAAPAAPGTVTDSKGREWKPIGKNADGVDLFEDQRGVRSYVLDGIRYTEPVTLDPRGGISTNRDIHPEYEVAPTAPQEPHEAFISSVRDKLIAGEKPFRTIVEARKLAKEHGVEFPKGIPAEKHVDELVERAVVAAARTIAEKGESHADTFARMVALYDNQPRLSTRTSTSVAEQAYSTPAPLAYVASRLAGIGRKTYVLEPTAGNGMLLMEADPRRARVNELNEARAKSLEAQGFTPTKADAALEATFAGRAGQMDAVIANPPFGAVREGGKSKVFSVGDFNTTQVDHAIVLNALKSLKADGRAVLIIGGVKAETPSLRAAGYGGKAKRRFFHNLMKDYKVSDIFTVSGDLYEKQGAAWPVDVIVIEGRGQTERTPLTQEAPPLFKTWDEVGAKLNEAPERAEPAEAATPIDTGEGSESSRATVEGQPGQAGNEAGNALGGEPALPGEPVQREPAEEQPAGVGEASAGGQPGPAEREPSVAQGEGSAPGERGNVREPNLEPSPARKRPVAEIKEGQTTYEPASQQGVKLNTLLPANLRDATSESLDHLQQEHGNIDEYVANALGRKPEELGKYFSAEQIDAIGLGISNIQKGEGFIIGDQTGIGKGRVVAAMITYARRNGLIPLFVTEKPDLYGDMWRDLHDIGWHEQLGRPIQMTMTNANTRVPLDDAALEWIAERDEAREENRPVPPQRGAFSPSQSVERSSDTMRKIANGELTPDVVFTTYDQMNSVKGKETPRRNFLRAIAPHSFLIMDEAHNAGGSAADSGSWREKDAAPPRSEVFRDAVQAAHSVMYSSATYAKSPNVMTLYSKTDMAKAVEDARQLPALISRGGVPLQQVVASMLAKAGQYLRRERSFEGVSYEHKTVPVNEEAYGQFTNGLRSVFEFDQAFEGERKDLAKAAAASKFGGSARDTGVGDAAASSTSFSAIMHNVVSQMIMATKARQAGEEAVAALKAGEKPVIALSKTNASFIKDFSEAAGLSIGDTANISFADILRRYLERTRRVTLKLGNDEKVHHTIPLSDMSPSAQARYRHAEDLLRDIDVGDLPVSPIDAIRHVLQKEGYSVREITGRDEMLDYSGGEPILSRRPSSEMGASGKKLSVAQFNNGSLDAVILNKSGSTGISLHASSKFKDQRRRRMIIAEADPNIDTHMQMLGRVHRTGQVIAPAYTHLAADIPAEVRPTAVLMRKMASLNANTTGAAKSRFTSEAVDFLNKYGDQVVEDAMLLDPETHERLGAPLSFSKDAVNENAAAKITGRLTLLDPAAQQSLLDRITESYKSLIETLDAAGQNDLEAKHLDLQARVLETKPLKPETGSSPFQGPVNLDKVSIKSQGRALSPDEVVARVAEAVKAPEGYQREFEDIARLAETGLRRQQQLIENTRKKFAEISKGVIAGIKDAAAKERASKKANDDWMAWKDLASIAHPGAKVTVHLGGEDIPAIVIGFTQKGDAKSPVALSTWEALFALPTSARTLGVPLSRLSISDTPKEGSVGISHRSSVSHAALADMFDQARKEGREERWMISGNILAGYDQTQGRGQIVTHTMEDGTVRPAILMSKQFNAKEFTEGRAVRFSNGEHVLQYLQAAKDGEVSSADGIITISKQGGEYKFEMPAAKATGGKYYTDKAVRDVYDFWIKRGQKMMGYVSPYQASRIIDAMKEVGAVFETRKDQDMVNSLRPPKTQEEPAGEGREYHQRRQSNTPGTPRNPIIEAIQRRDKAVRELDNYIAHQDDMSESEAERFYRTMLAQIDGEFHETALKYQIGKGKGDVSYLPSDHSWKDILSGASASRPAENDTGFHGAFSEHKFAGEDIAKFRDRLGMRDNETYADWAERIVAEADAAGKKRILPPRLPQWLESMKEEAFARPEKDVPEAHPEPTKTQPEQPSYMATPEDHSANRWTAEALANDRGISQEEAAAKLARWQARQPVSARDLPPEEKPADLTPQEKPVDLTPDMEVKEDNRPEPEKPASDLDHIRRQKRASDLDYIRGKLRKDGFYRISEPHRQETFRIADGTVRKLAPPGVKVFVIKEIMLGPDGEPWVAYESSTGEQHMLPESLSRPVSTFGFFEPSSNSIFLNRVTALGQSDHLLRGIVVHEVTHFARMNGVFSPAGALKNSWLRILRHANDSGLLDMTVGEYADLIGDPLPGSKTVTYRNLFDKLYQNGIGKQEKLDGEAVALSIQLYDGLKAVGDPGLAFFDPVKRDIESFLSGEHQSRTLMHVPVLGEGDALYGGAGGHPRGREDAMLREPAWPLRIDPIESMKADHLREAISEINNPKDYDWAIRELQRNRTLTPEERTYLDELAKYTSGHVPGRRNTMVATYYALTSGRLNQPVSVSDFFGAYRERAEKIEGTEHAQRKIGKPFYVKDEEKFRSHLEMYGRENDADLGAKIPSQPKAWLLDKDADTVSLSPFISPAYVKEFGQGKIGSISFNDKDLRATIRIMENSDASTIIHEFGHDFLERLKRYAAHELAPEQLRKDWETTKSWLGAADGNLKTRHHEKFARGFEQYMREGVAPSKTLAGVFARFRDWLLNIYQTIKGLGKPINDDIRGVFDRMLAEEPQKTVIAPDAVRGQSLADLHEQDAAETHPSEAEAAADRVQSERLRHEAELHPEVQSELKPEVDRVEAEAAAAEGAQPAGEAGAGAEGRGEVVEGGGEPEPVSAGGARGEGSGAVSGSGGKPETEGGGVSGSKQRSNVRKNAGNGVPIPGSTTTFEPTESKLVDKAGNIRIENLTTRQDVAQAIRDAAEANNDFIGDRRGVITDGQVLELADALGMDVEMLSKRKLGQAFNAEQVMAARKLLIQSATDVHAAMKQAAEGTDEDVMAYAKAKDRHQMIQAQIAGITAEAGRALRAFRDISEDANAQAVDQFIKQATGKTLFQLRREAKLGAMFDAPWQVSRFLYDAKRHNFGSQLLEYWINGLISGPATHITYGIGNLLLSLEKAGPETLLAAGVGAARRAMGREGPTVRAGEVGAQIRAAVSDLPSALHASMESLRTGQTALMPGEKMSDVLPVPGLDAVPAPRLNTMSTYRDVMESAFAIARGIRDGFVAAGTLVTGDGGIPGATTWAWRYPLVGAIPDLTYKGVGVIPVGQIARAPSRMLSAMHTLFRSINYSMEKAALAYRQASEEGLQGMELARRVGELHTNPTGQMMKQASSEASDLTLMSKGGEFTALLSHLTNVRVNGFPLFKFIDPFVRISGNVINQALLRRSPLGLALSGEVRRDLAGENGTIAQDRAAARMLAGTALCVGFGTLAAQGLVSGSGPKDPRKAAMWRLAGNQPHSVRIGDTWYDVHRLGPLGMIMGMAADLYDVAHKVDEGHAEEAAAHLLHAVTQNILDESFMRGPAELIQAIEDPDRHGQAYIQNFLSSFTPYSVGMSQIAHASDPYTRQAHSTIDAIKRKIPGMSEELLPKRDIWGEPIPNPDALGGAGVTALYEHQVSTDPVNLAMLRLGIAPAQVSKHIRNVELTDQERDDYQRIAGRMAKMRLDAIVKSPQFANMPPFVQHDVIAASIKQSREAASGLMLMKYPHLIRDSYDAKVKKVHSENIHEIEQ